MRLCRVWELRARNCSDPQPEPSDPSQADLWQTPSIPSGFSMTVAVSACMEKEYLWGIRSFSCSRSEADTLEMVQVTLSEQLSCSWIKVWVVEHPWIPWGRVCVPAGNIPVSHCYNRTRAVLILYLTGIHLLLRDFWRTPKILLWSENTSVGRCFQKWWMFPLWFADDWFGLQMFGSFVGSLWDQVESYLCAWPAFWHPSHVIALQHFERPIIGFGLMWFGVVWFGFFPGWKAFPCFEAWLTVDKTEGLILQALDFPFLKTSCPSTGEEFSVMTPFTGSIFLYILI